MLYFVCIIHFAFYHFAKTRFIRKILLSLLSALVYFLIDRMAWFANKLQFRHVVNFVHIAIQ